MIREKRALRKRKKKKKGQWNLFIYVFQFLNLGLFRFNFFFSNGFNLFLVMGVSYYCFSGKVLIFNVWVQFVWTFVWLLRKSRKKKKSSLFIYFLFLCLYFLLFLFVLEEKKKKKSETEAEVLLSLVQWHYYVLPIFFDEWKFFQKFYSDFFVLLLFSQRPNIAEFYVVSFSFLFMWVNVYECLFLFLSCFL